MRTIVLLFALSVSVALAQRTSKQEFDTTYGESLKNQVKNKVASRIAQLNISPSFLAYTTDSITQAIRETLKSVQQPVVGRTYDVAARTGILPITFSKLEKKDNSYSLGKSITMGAGISWLWGQAHYVDSKTIDIDPDLFLGVGLDVGPRVTDEDKLGFSLGLSVYVGFQKVGLSVGRDFINGLYLIGVATTIDLSSLNLFNTTVISISDIIKPDE